MHNPQLGDVEAILPTATPTLSSLEITDNGTMFGFAENIPFVSGATDSDANTGLFYSIDPATGAATQLGASGLTTFNTYDEDGDGIFEVVATDPLQVESGMEFSALSFDDVATNGWLYGVASRGSGAISHFEPETYGVHPVTMNVEILTRREIPSKNFLYRINPNTGAVINRGNGQNRQNDARATGAGTEQLELGRITFLPGNLDTTR